MIRNLSSMETEIVKTQCAVVGDVKLYPGKVITVKHAGGRPMKIKGAAALKKRVDSYFKKCDDEQMPYTMSGLALALGVSRATLKNYETVEYYGFGNIIEMAKTKIENYMEKRLFDKKQCVGAIFALKNNFEGWIEKSETKIKGPMGDVLDFIQQNGKTKNAIVKRS